MVTQSELVSFCRAELEEIQTHVCENVFISCSFKGGWLFIQAIVFCLEHSLFSIGTKLLYSHLLNTDGHNDRWPF